MNKALKDLIALGRSQKTVEVFGKSWKLHTLDAQDQLLATNSTSDYDNLSRVMALKVAILAHAIDSVDGEPLGNAGESRELLNKLQVPLINRLYNEYEKLMDIQDDKLRDLDKIKTNDEAPEEEESSSKAI